MQIANALLLWYLFGSLDGWLSEPKNRLAKILSLIGRNTLAVYFIHFFLLFSVPYLPQLLESMKHDAVFGTHSCDSLIEFVSVGILAILISLASIAISKILRLFPIAYTLCLGPVKAAK